MSHPAGGIHVIVQVAPEQRVSGWYCGRTT
jgi:hypothetical protein